MANRVQEGDTILETTFNYVPYDPSLEGLQACGTIQKYSTNEWKDKRVVLFGVPAGFSTTCQMQHFPPFLESYDAFKEKNVDIIACVATNDAFVQSAWGRANKAGDKILMLSDGNAAWSIKSGLSVDRTASGMGIRTVRFAAIIDDLKIKFLGVDEGRGQVKLSAAENVLSHL